MPNQGIQAKFGGDCRLCGQRWQKNDWIDKIPGTDERAHVVCINGGTVPANAGRATTSPSPPNVAPISSAAAFHEIRTGLVATAEAMKEAANWLDVAREGIEKIVAGIDATQTATPSTPPRAAGVRR